MLTVESNDQDAKIHRRIEAGVLLGKHLFGIEKTVRVR
jgi:hypothetical protein